MKSFAIGWVLTRCFRGEIPCQLLCHYDCDMLCDGRCFCLDRGDVVVSSFANLVAITPHFYTQISDLFDCGLLGC